MRKLLQFKLYSFLSSKWGMTFCVVGLFVTLNAFFQIVQLLLNNPTGVDVQYDWTDNISGRSNKDIMCTPPIDVVYTWVNGSDPHHIKAVNDLKKRLRDPAMLPCNTTQTPEKDFCYQDEDTQSRFIDNEELRYSLRSLEVFAPWVRHIYIVTNGQIPYWINLDHPRLSIVTHEDIFVNKSHLPTFSSPSIEAHLHRIPNLSSKFIYLNDDVMFGREIYPDDFYTHSYGQKVFLSWPVPNCAEGCPSNWIGDGYCDLACNVSACDFDAHDCDNYTGPASGASGSRWWNTGSTYPSTSDISSRYKNYCAKGCPDTWIGDKYCDRMCKNVECGFDAGDCGVDDIFASMQGVEITWETTRIDLPPGLPSVYFNLSSIVHQDTITDGSHDNAELVRTATISQKHKIMTLTFHRNISLQEVMLSITAEHGEGTNKTSVEKTFNITIDTTIVPTAVNETENSTTDFRVNPGSTNIESTPTSVSDTENGDNNTVNITDISAPTHTLPNSSNGNESVIPETPNSQYKENNPAGPEGSHGSGIVLTEQRPDQEGASESSKGGLDSNQVNTELSTDPMQPSSIEVQNTAGAGSRSLLSIPIDDTTSHEGAIQQLQWDEMTARKKEQMQVMEQESTSDAEKEQLLRINKDYEALLQDSFEQTEDEKGAKVWPWERQRQIDNVREMRGGGRRLLDMYGDSLKHVNKLFNHAFGPSSRKVPAHMPHMIDKSIMEELQARWPEEWERTSSHSLRHPQDMQYAFAYFYYLIHARVDYNFTDIWKKELDVNNDGKLNDNELRTLGVHLYGAPLKNSSFVELKERLLNVCQTVQSHGTDYSDLEEHGGSSEVDECPITLSIVESCNKTSEELRKVFSKRLKYKHQLDGTDEVAFLMVGNNDTVMQGKLDGVRQKRHRFICLNDNINHSSSDAGKVVSVLHDFYMSLLPIPSSFEHPPHVRNAHSYIGEVYEARMAAAKKRQYTIAVGSLALLALLYVVFRCYRCMSQADRRARERRANRFLNT